MFIAANTRWPAIGRRLYLLIEYFEMVFLKILPSVNMSVVYRLGTYVYYIHEVYMPSQRWPRDKPNHICENTL